MPWDNFQETRGQPSQHELLLQKPFRRSDTDSEVASFLIGFTSEWNVGIIIGITSERLSTSRGIRKQSSGLADVVHNALPEHIKSEEPMNVKLTDHAVELLRVARTQRGEPAELIQEHALENLVREKLAEDSESAISASHQDAVRDLIFTAHQN